MSYRYGQVRREADQLGAELLDSVGGKLEDLIAAREDVAAALRVLRIVADELEERALARWPEEGFDWQVQVPGVGTFHRGTKNPTDRWDHRGLGHEVASAALTKGLIDHPRDVVDVIDTACSLGYWRQKEVAKLGVDWKPFRTRTRGNPCINLSI